MVNCCINVVINSDLKLSRHLFKISKHYLRLEFELQMLYDVAQSMANITSQLSGNLQPVICLFVLSSTLKDLLDNHDYADSSSIIN